MQAQMPALNCAASKCCDRVHKEQAHRAVLNSTIRDSRECWHDLHQPCLCCLQHTFMVAQQQVPQGIHHVGHLPLIAVGDVAQSRLAQHLQAKVLTSGGVGLLLQIMLSSDCCKTAGHALTFTARRPSHGLQLGM